MSPEESCRRKVRFRTREQAQRRARFLRTYGGRGYRKLTAYACWYCGRWHIGHPLGMHAEDRY